MLDGAGFGSVRRNAFLLERIVELSRIVSRAASAAHYYETMNSQSNAHLKQKGLRRSDLPRAAYMFLTEEP
jgi:hypothetical protein